METDFAGDFMGPRLRALPTDLMRRFAILMAGGAASAAEAAREAGYSNSSDAAKVQAHRLMHDPTVLAAIEECTRSGLQTLAPRAVRAAKAILDDPKHRGHARMIETVLDRTGFFAKTEHKVTVEHTVGLKELEDLARRLALENGIAPERFIGVTIEAEVADGEQAAAPVEVVRSEGPV